MCVNELFVRQEDGRSLYKVGDLFYFACHIYWFLWFQYLTGVRSWHLLAGCKLLSTEPLKVTRGHVSLLLQCNFEFKIESDYFEHIRKISRLVISLHNKNMSLTIFVTLGVDHPPFYTVFLYYLLFLEYGGELSLILPCCYQVSQYVAYVAWLQACLVICCNLKIRLRHEWRDIKLLQQQKTCSKLCVSGPRDSIT